MGLNVLALAAIAVCGVTLILSCVAVGIPHWLIFDENNIKINTGLWRRCAEVGSTETCDDVKSSDYSTDAQYRGVKATRAFVILGILVLPGAVVVGLLVLFVMKDKKILYFAAAGCAFGAGFFHMLGFAIYAGEVKDHSSLDNFDYGAGFALTIVSWIMAWVSGGLFVGAKMMDKD